MQSRTRTAANSDFLYNARRTWNAKIYKQVRAIYNEHGLIAASNYLQLFTTARIPFATNQPPKQGA